MRKRARSRRLGNGGADIDERRRACSDLQQSNSLCEELSGPASDLQRALEQNGFLVEERDKLYARCKALEGKLGEVRDDHAAATLR